MTNHYQTLGVNKNATADEIKKAYRKLASITHPDKGGDTKKFQELQAAYDVLSDEQKRRSYDNPMPNFESLDGRFNFHGVDINDIFQNIFKQEHHRPKQPVYRTIIFVTLEQVLLGGEQQIQFQTNEKYQVVTIKVPKGIADGNQIKYENIIPNALLLVEFRITAHLKFNRNGNDLIYTHPISVLDLITGTTIEFTTLSGKKLEVTVPPKTQPHMHLRLSGEGLPMLNNSHYGDQIILLKPFVPTNIPDKIVEAIKSIHCE